MVALALIKKDFKGLIKSKLTWFSLFILPLIVALLLSISLNSYGLQNIKIAYHVNFTNISHTAQANVLSLIKFLEEKGYGVLKSNTSEECIENVKLRSWHICMIVESGGSTDEMNIQLFVDESRLNLAYALINQVSELIQIKSEEISISLVQVLINTIESNEKELIEIKKRLDNLKSNIHGIKTEKSNIENNAKAMDTYFSIDEFDLSELEDLVDELENTNASNLSDDFMNAISKIRSKLADVETRFSSIEGKKNVVINSTRSLASMIEKIEQSSNQLTTSQEKMSNEIKNVKQRNVSIITSPIKTFVKPIATKTKNLDLVLPAFIAFFIVTITLFVASAFTIKEKTSKAYFRNFLAPVKDSTFVFSTYVVLLTIILVEILLIIAVVFPFTNILDKKVLLNFLPIFILSITAFIAIGMFIGYIGKREEIVVLIIFFVLLALLFFSPILMPYEMFKQAWIKNAIAYSPFNIVENSLKEIIFFRFSIAKEWLSLLILLAYSAIFFVLTIIAKKFTKHQLIYV